MPLRLIALVALLPVVLVGILYRPLWGVFLFVGLFYLSPQSFIWGLASFRLPFMVAVTTLVASLRPNAGPRAPFPGQMLLLWLFLAMVLISALFAEGSFDNALPELELLLKTGVFCLLMCRLIGSVPDIENFMWASLGGALPLALWGIRQYFAGNYRLERIGGGQLIDSSALSAAFVFLIPYALFYAREKVWWKKWIAWLSVPAMFMATILTFTRASSLALMFYGIYALIRFRKHFLRNLLVTALVVGLVVLFAPSEYWGRMQTILPFLSPEAQGSEPIEDWRRSEDIHSAANRLEYWKVGFAMFMDHPVFGVGINHFSLIIDRYIPGEYHVTHNTYLQVLAETGLAGFLPFIGILILTFYNLSFAERRAAAFDEPERVRRFCEASRMGLLGFMVCMFFLSRQSYEPLYWLFTLSALARSLYFPARRRQLQPTAAAGAAYAPAFRPTV